MSVKKTILALVIIVGVGILGVFSYSFLKKGKYLSEVELQMVRLPYEHTVISCLGLYFNDKKNTTYDKIVVRTEEEYQNFIDEVRAGPADNCSVLEFPDFDFQEETLVGARASHWCRAYFKRNMRIDDSKGLYRYIIQEKLDCIPIIGCMARDCMLRRTLNLATIPKMKDDYQMRVEVYHNPWR